ncbi:MAG: hypothetical protein IJ679_10520, partial [Lachnospiraceae bacterium]|nr:hypothetical protein [Lachnospiraceae bacterium]
MKRRIAYALSFALSFTSVAGGVSLPALTGVAAEESAAQSTDSADEETTETTEEMTADSVAADSDSEAPAEEASEASGVKIICIQQTCYGKKR